jgi:hypothetical protein
MYLVQSGAWDISFDRDGNRMTATPGAYTISAAFPSATFEKSIGACSVKISVSA